jgi:hypothetical protein
MLSCRHLVRGAAAALALVGIVLTAAGAPGFGWAFVLLAIALAMARDTSPSDRRGLEVPWTPRPNAPIAVDRLG